MTKVKYFFLSDGWTYSRVWEFGGLWDESTWRRKPEIKRLNCGIVEQGEILWLYQVEDAVLMIEVKPTQEVDLSAQNKNIGQVVLKRLINAEQVIEVLTRSEIVAHPNSSKDKK
jgi:recombinational DNA repair protein RecT